MSPESLVHYVRHNACIVRFERMAPLHGLMIGGQRVGRFYKPDSVGEFDCWEDACAYFVGSDHGLVADAYEHLESLAAR